MWVKLDDGFTEHIKLERAGPLAGWLHVCALCYCARQLSDGRIPKSKVMRLADVPKPAQLAAKLVEVGLWEEDGDDYVVHDYHDWNPTAEEERDKRRKRAEAGRKGGLKSRPPGARGEANPEANASANAQADAEAEEKRNGTPSPSPSPSPPEESSQRTRTARSSKRRTTPQGDLDGTDGTPDERVLRAIDAATEAEVDAAVKTGKCTSQSGLTKHVRQRNIDEHFQDLLPLARKGWTARDLWSRMDNPKHIPVTRKAAS